ncbi:MAG: CHAT domain-containing protein, partial [Pleurocapsa sp. MO_226.B13]|nr:CHAT domain-containing protein [Pleurocapsa sp. MO_226.B13]
SVKSQSLEKIYEQNKSQNPYVQENWRDLNQAIDLWQKSASNYHDEGKKDLEIKIRLKISQGYISLNKFDLAIEELNQIIDLNPDRQKLALVFEKLGNVHTRLNEPQKAIVFYTKSIQNNNKSISALNSIVKALEKRSQVKLFKASQASREKEATKYSLQSERARSLARKYAKSALNLSKNNSSPSAVRAIIAWSQLFKQPPPADLLKRGTSILDKLEPSRSTIFTILGWSSIDLNNKESWLKKADEMAFAIGDAYAESYVKTELGYFYLENKSFERALSLAQEAQLLAQSNFALDSLFRSQTLSGKIYLQTGQNEKALDNYKGAIASIDAIFAQNIDDDRTSQILDFKRDLEPVYRETLNLILSNPEVTQNRLDRALIIYDKLQIAQLREYFGDNCLEIVREQVIDPDFSQKNTVLINSIILDDQVFLILRKPNGRKVLSSVKIEKAKLIKLAQGWYKDLTLGYSWEFRSGSRFFYDLIIAPFEAELQQVNPSALVFIHDGVLRNLPMAALHDGDRFLAQKWASVSSLGLEYTTTPEDQKSKFLGFGLQQSVRGWPELDNVRSEIEQIRSYVDGEVFLNDRFTSGNFSQFVIQSDYSILHLATHGYFSGNAETSFLVAYDQRISALKLESILSQSSSSIELLVLSACETAVGSELSLLGLAGIAARSGVKTIVGSLWQVGDENQSEMIDSFYFYLTEKKLDKASALQKAQIEQINLLAHPQKWASLSLIGSF